MKVSFKPKNLFPLLSLPALLFFLYSCDSSSSDNALSITLKNFQSEIEQQQNLSFTFNKELATDTELNQWSDIAYLNISPAVEGKFKWTSKNTLVFSPEKGFDPSTEYTAELTEKLFKHSGESYKIPDDIKKIKFHTPYLNLLGALAYWGIGQNGTPELKMNLQFNYAVPPSEVKEKAKITVGDQEVPFQILSNEESSTVQIALSGLSSEDLTNKVLNLDIASGISSPVSENAKGKRMTYETNIPPRNHFEISSVKAQRVGINGQIRVTTNQSVNLSEKIIASLVTLEPSVDFDIEKTNFGFLIKGDFDTKKAYKVFIDKELKGVFNRSLSKEFSQSVTFGAVRPQVKFADAKSIYLGSYGEQNIALQIAGIEEVELKVYKIYEQNILHFLRSTVGERNFSGHDRGGNYDGYYDFERGYGYYISRVDYGDFGNVILDKTVPLNRMSRSNGSFILNMEDITKADKFSERGIYVIDVASSKHRYVNDGKIITVSDMGFITKRSKDDIYVFVNSVKTAKPVQGANIELISRSNKSVVSAVSNDQGVAHFKNISSTFGDFDITMLTASKGSEFTFMHFNQNPVNVSDFELGGLSESPAGYMAYLYAERDLYRPGETVNVKGIVRNFRWKKTGKIPVVMDLLMPNGSVFTSKKGQLSAQGTFEASFPVPDNSVTGSYSVRLRTSNDLRLASKNINIEEFIPYRIRVEAEVEDVLVAAGQSVPVSARALNLFGPPAANRNYEVEMSLDRTYFSARPKKNASKYDRYNFRLTTEDYYNFYHESEIKTGKTGEDGGFQARFSVPSKYKNIGMLSGKIYSTVFDETGRPVGKKHDFEVYTQDAFFGIEPPERYWVGTNQALRFPVVALNPEGEVLNSAKAKIQIVRYEWQTVLEEYYGDYRYVSRKQKITEREISLNVNGTNTVLSYMPQSSGYHEIRVMVPGSEFYVSADFYAYNWATMSASSFEIDKEGKIDIKFDKDAYAKGETAKVFMKAPFSGEMLVTVERDKVYEYKYLKTTEGVASFDLPITHDHVPNIYVSATLIKPHVPDAAVPLTVAHGFKSVKVEDEPRHKMNLEIQAVEKSRSERKQTVTVNTGVPGAEVTVAVVDEGILGIKGYETPDPYDYFFQKRALSVNSYDMYPRLLPEIKATSQGFGSGAYDMGKRTNPLTNKRVKPAAFWSGTLIADASGKASYTFDIPSFSGDLRIMALAVKDEKFGSTDDNMKVADPIVLSTGLPRFLSPKDKVTVPVTVTNTTEKNAEGQAVIKASGSLKVLGNASKKVSIPAGREARVLFEVEASDVMGLGDVKVEVTALGETFDQKIDMTVRPSTSLLKEFDAGMVMGGSSKTLNFSHDFLPSSADGKLMVSKSPMVRFTDDLRYLIRYPHGCLEQTVSSAFPQLYLSDVSEAIGNMIGENMNPDENVRAAISKLYTMQLYNGALAYWRGGSYENYWATAYATHFLMEAQKAGFEVEEPFLNRLYGYLSQKARNKETDNYHYYDDTNRPMMKRIAKKEIFYSLYILAQAGRQDLSVMNYFKANPQLMSKDSRYMLAATYKFLGDEKSFRRLLPDNMKGEKAKQDFGGNFSSFIRDQAIALNMLIENDPKNGQIGQMAQQLTLQMKQSPYLNTQERAFALLALGKLARKAAGSNVSATVKVNGSTLANFDGKGTLVLTEGLAGKNVTLETQGEGELYYFQETEGISATGRYKEEDSFLKVRKTFFDRNGNELSGMKFKQNDLVVVRIALVSTKLNAVENVVITDMLPAGFEIENPRIGNTQGMNWVKNASYPEHYDFRDDRVNIFVTADKKTKYYYYVVRAVSPGTFRMGPVSADAMYNGQYHSYHGAGEINVVQ